MRHLPTTNILQRVFCLFYGKYYGTCFTLDVEGCQYIVTAKHLVPDLKGEDTVRILHESRQKTLPVRLVGHADGRVDISVLAAGLCLSPTHELRAVRGEVMLAEEIYFMGFPYQFSSGAEKINRGFPVPCVKKGIVSALSADQAPLLLDAHNNDGFSGGPVVRMEGKTPTVIAVISGYEAEQKAVYLGEDETDLSLGENSGITISYAIGNALDLIKNNPIGFKLPVSE